MPITVKPGTRLLSAVDETEMIVVKANGDLDLTIGGAAPVTSAEERTMSGPMAGFDSGSLIGKRYVDQSDIVELLCTKAGAGVPALDGVSMQIKTAKALPASD